MDQAIPLDISLHLTVIMHTYLIYLIKARYPTCLFHLLLFVTLITL